MYKNWTIPDNSVLGGHTTGTQSQTGGDDSGQTLGDGGDGKSNGNLEVVDGALDPGATVSGVVEVTNVDGPDGNTDKSDNLDKRQSNNKELYIQDGSGHLTC